MENIIFRQPVVVTAEKSAIDKNFSGTVVLVERDHNMDIHGNGNFFQVAVIHQYENGVLSGPSYDFSGANYKDTVKKTETTKDNPSVSKDYQAITRHIQEFREEDYKDNPNIIFDKIVINENVEYLTNTDGNMVERRVIDVPGNDTHHVLVDISAWDKLSEAKINISYQKDTAYLGNKKVSDHIVNFDAINKPTADKLRAGIADGIDHPIEAEYIDINIAGIKKGVMDFLKENYNAIKLNVEFELDYEIPSMIGRQTLSSDDSERLKTANLKDLKVQMDKVVENMADIDLQSGAISTEEGRPQNKYRIIAVFEELWKIDTNYPSEKDEYIKNFYNAVEPSLNDETTELLGKEIINNTSLVPDHGGDKIKNTISVLLGDSTLLDLDKRIGGNRKLVGVFETDIEKKNNARTLIDGWLKDYKQPELHSKANQ